MTVGDLVCLIPPPSKSDRWAVHWGCLPIWLPWVDDPLNAAFRLSLVEQLFPVSVPRAASTPLFRTNTGAFFASQVLPFEGLSGQAVSLLTP